MKRILFLLSISFIIASEVRSADVKVEATLAQDKDSKPTTTFAVDVPKIYAFFRTKGTEKGDKLRSVWIAEDVGDAAPANTKIDEASLAADQDDFSGAFSLSKPTKGWPPGKYRVEIYAGDDLAETLKFTIKAGKTEDKSDDGPKDGASDE